MSEGVLLGIQTCSSCSPAFIRHWPYFQRQQADYYIAIVTEDKPCQVPPGVPKIEVGVDKYLDGAHLPNRLINSISKLLHCSWDILILCEYDVLIVNRIQTENMTESVAAHLAGGRTWGSIAEKFYHNPFVMTREAAMKVELYGRHLLSFPEFFPVGSPESSPDLFFAWLMQRHSFAVQTDLWREYSRNSLDVLGHLDEARQAYRDGYDILHGIKTKEELDFITT